jgi:hypothetical protein
MDYPEPVRDLAAVSSRRRGIISGICRSCTGPIGRGIGGCGTPYSSCRKKLEAFSLQKTCKTLSWRRRGRQNQPFRSPAPTQRTIQNGEAAKLHGVLFPAAIALLVADGLGSNTETSRTLLLCADLAIVPAKASMLEVRALKQATLALHHARKIRRGRRDANAPKPPGSEGK